MYDILYRMSTEQIDVDVYARELGKNNNIAELERLYPTSTHKQWFVDMAVIGAVEGKAKLAGDWALRNGACYLWPFNQARDTTEYIRAFGYSKNLSMLKGPGDVLKGTFKDGLVSSATK